VGAERLGRRLETLSVRTSNVQIGDQREPFREMNSVTGPLVAAAATALAFALSAMLRDGWTAATLPGATWLVLGLAFWTFLWTYASLQLGRSSGARPSRSRHGSTRP
jgi:hypothetical protein